MSRTNWITIAAAALCLLVIAYFAPNIWHAITWIGGGLGFVLWLVWVACATVLGWLWNLLGLGLQLAMPALTMVVAFLLVVAAFVVGAGLLIGLSLLLTGYLGAQLKEIGQQVRELHLEFRVETGRAARDTAFLTLVATLCALVAYMGTEEFLKHISTVRFLAVSCIGLVAAKLFFSVADSKTGGVFPDRRDLARLNPVYRDPLSFC
jgi:hypothetical protein